MIFVQQPLPLLASARHCYCNTAVICMRWPVKVKLFSRPENQGLQSNAAVHSIVRAGKTGVILLPMRE